MGDAPTVKTDDFATWENPIDWWPKLLDRVLVPLSRGEPARFERSRWGGPATGVRRAGTDEFLVLEGVTASREAFAPYLTYSIWVETPAELCLERGLERDGPEALAQWRAWIAAEDRYIESERPDQRADLVIDGGRDLWT